ncbi:hypothetical protein AB0O20_11480 [Streptomyces kronopolitis]|uniref:hypothetical protein n=1 Tax=Streptomyces kronopolitis TaxID=1612435 RepID=UPI00343CCE4C
MADETATIYEQLRDLAGEIESLADAVGAPGERSITQASNVFWPLGQGWSPASMW